MLMFNRTTLLVVIAALAAGLGLWASQRMLAPKAEGPALELARMLPTPREIPAFSLSGADGAVVDPAALRGRWTLVFIGFTHCPDVCPTTLAELGQAERRWSEALPEAERPRILFVSIDPERDTPELAQEYAGHFTRTGLAATGSVPALEAFARSLSMVFMKVPQGETYTMDHSSQVALLDPEARFAGFIRPQPMGTPGPSLPPEKLAADLVALVEAGR